MTIKKVTALIVTYNRADMLEKTINLIANQDIKVNNLIIIDNNSADLTEKTVNRIKTENSMEFPRIAYTKLSENVGGAGGFNLGFKIFQEQFDDDYLWVMDDDAFPEKDALISLVDASKTAPDASFFASSVVSQDGLPMNVSVVDSKPTANGYSDWYMLAAEKLIKIQTATFVSLLIPRESIEKAGYPIGQYFIWGDDTEYTQRLTTLVGPAYLVADSKVVHMRSNPRALDIMSETNPDRISMYRYFYRNTLLNIAKFGSKLSLLRKILKFESESFVALFKGGKTSWYSFRAIQTGIIMFFAYRKRKVPWTK